VAENFEGKPKMNLKNRKTGKREDGMKAPLLFSRLPVFLPS
jgi:hypothetical protein